MNFKALPKIDARYWVAISIASMCGTNLGDLFPDVFKLGTPVALIILGVCFIGLNLIDRASKSGNEAFYWLTILVVRAAATQIADFSVEQRHWAYFPVAAVLACMLVGLVAIHARTRGPEKERTLPRTSGWYWITMLTAGALGTIVGDGLGHAFGPMTTGVPISVVSATLALAIVLYVRRRLQPGAGASYWLAIVTVRWWGTNAGDILAFVTSLVVSLAVTGLALAAVLLIWRPGPGAGDKVTIAGR